MPSDIFASADDRLGCRYGLELVAQGESPLQHPGETLPGVAASEQAPSCIRSINCAEAGNASFHDGAVYAADSGDFTGTVHAGPARLLLVVHTHEPCLGLAANQRRQLQVRDESEGARQDVAFQLKTFRPIGERNSADLVVALGADGPPAAPVGHTDHMQSDVQSLEPLAWVRRNRYAETGQAAPRCLLSDHADLGPAFSQIGRHGQQQGTAAGDDHPFALDCQACLGHRLQPAGPDHLGKCPTRKGHEELAGAWG